MKHGICLGLSLGILSTAVAWAGDVNYSDNNASGYMGAGALSVVAAPLLITAGAVGVVAGTAGEVVKLVGASGEGLSELTTYALNDVAESDDSSVSTYAPVTNYNITMTGNYQAIPIVARKQYVQFNERITE